MKKYFTLFILFVMSFGFTQVKPAEEPTVMAAPKAETIEEVPEEVAFAVIEQIPIFKGCEDVPKEEQMVCFNQQMNRHIQQNFYYPEEALDNDADGRVNVLFVIDKEGFVTDIQVRGPRHEYGKLLEDEARRIIEKLPRFQPGMQKGKPVKVRYMLPITFRLN